MLTAGNTDKQTQKQTTQDTDIKGPGDMKSVLDWALSHSDPQKFKELKHKKLSKEDIEFLFKSKAVVDPVQEMKHYMEHLKPGAKIKDEDTGKERTPTLDDKLKALDEIMYFSEKTDYANDFQKIGGLQVLLDVLRNKESEIQVVTGTLWVLATQAQNNGYIQNHLLQMNALEAITDLFTRQWKDATSAELLELRKKIIHMLNAFVSSNPTAVKLFITNGGVKSIFQEIQQSKDISIKGKCIFLLVTIFIATEQEKSKSIVEEITKLEKESFPTFVNVLKEALEQDNLDLMEHTLLLLYEYLKNVENKREIVHKLMKFGARDAINGIRQKVIKDKDEKYVEVRSYLKKIILLMNAAK